MEYALKSESEDLIPHIHFFLSHAYYDLEKKSEALRHIKIAIELWSKSNESFNLEQARKHEKRIKRSQSFWGF